MYIYGISIGMDFRDIAKLFMSDVGNIIIELLESNVFTGEDGYSRTSYIFKYFNDGPVRHLNKFDVNRDLNRNYFASPLKFFKQRFVKEIREAIDKEGKPLPIAKAIVRFARSNYTLEDKLNTIEGFRKYYNQNNTYANELYNQLIDFVEDYVRQVHLISENENTFNDIQILSEGAEEMYILGQILSLNQGIKTSIDEILNQINLIERAIYNKTGKLEDLVDLTKFAFDEQYRQQCIQKYETVKHSFNIYDIVSVIPHFLGYIQVLATTLNGLNQSYKFRSVKNLTLELSRRLEYKREDKLIRGIQNFVGDQLRKWWMKEKQVVIPKGNKAFDKYGNLYDLTEDTLIRLGTDWGDATFRMFIENEVIPNLKKGMIKTNSNVDFGDISHNKFIQNLSNDILTNTVSRNPSIIYTLPINMSPRVDQERNLLNIYKAEFNKLAKYSYQYQVSSYDQNGNIQLHEESIPLVDLFTYYAMIADSWKLGEKSLVPILEDFQNTGIIDDFHKFVAAIDKSQETLSLDQIDLDDILPYVAPFESPYNSYAKFIQYRNPKSRKYQIMKKLTSADLEVNGLDNIDYQDPNIIESYRFRTTDIDTNYFPTGNIESPTRIVQHQYEDNGKTNNIKIEYEVESGKIQSITLNNVKIDIPELVTIPTIKLNGIRKVNVQLLESIIKHKTNPC